MESFTDLFRQVGAAVAMVVVLVTILGVMLSFRKLYVKVKPNEALFVYGRKTSRRSISSQELASRKSAIEATKTDLVAAGAEAVVAGRGEVAVAEKKLAQDSAVVERGFRIVKGGGTIVWPVIESTATLSLGLMTIEVAVENVYTGQGVPINADGVAQIKVSGDDDGLMRAAEQLLGKTPDQIQSVAKQTLAGHFRAILGKLTVEQINADRDAFASQVGRLASEDMAGMGLTIVSFTIRDISDPNGYLDALGKEQTAKVKKDAAIAQARAKQEERTASAAADQAGQLAEFVRDKAVAETAKEVEVAKAGFKVEQDTARAQANMALDLQEAAINKDLAVRQGAVKIAQVEQEALAAERRIQVTRQIQQAEVVVPASAEREAAKERAEANKITTETKAEAEANALLKTATAQAEATKLNAGANAEQIRATRTAEATGIQVTGEAEAAATSAKLLAQAEGESKLAEARSSQGEVNLRLEIAKALIGAEVQKLQAVSTALAGIGANVKVVQVGPGSQDNALMGLLGQVPELAMTINEKVKAMSGGSDVMTVLGEVLRVLNTTAAAAPEHKADAPEEKQA